MLVLVALAGCTSQSPVDVLPVSSSPGPTLGMATPFPAGGTTQTGLNVDRPRVEGPVGGILGDDPAPHLAALGARSDSPVRMARPASDSPMQAVGAHVDDLDANPDLGDEITAAIDDLPANRASYGVSGLTFDEQLGSGALCVPPEVQLVLGGDDGTRYEADLLVGSYIAFVGGVDLAYDSLSPSCEDGLAAAGGDVDAAYAAGDCTDTEVEEYFPEDSDCRACLADEAGDFDACVSADRCDARAVAKTWVENALTGEVEWWDIMVATMWACAPAYTTSVYLLGDASDGIPRPFANELWAYACVPFWDEDADGLTFVCGGAADTGPERGDTVAEGFAGYVEYIRQPGETTTPYKDRPTYIAEGTFTAGAVIDYSWAWTPGAGAISLDPFNPDTNGSGEIDLGDENFGYGWGGWGLDPYELRPDATDPSDPEQTFALDYIAMASMKGATTRNGVQVIAWNHNRCTEWEGPDDDGAMRCQVPPAPDAGWLNDGQAVWASDDGPRYYAFMMPTLASTGRGDPDVPGGFMIDIAGSPDLANPAWDDCALPHTFVPDQMQLPDVPDAYDPELGLSLTGQTYDLAKGDYRMVLGTNQMRGWCPADATGEVPRP